MSRRRLHEDVLVDEGLQKCHHHSYLPHKTYEFACYGEWGRYASDAAHWCIAPPLIDPRFLDVALNDESGLESPVCLLLEDEA